MILPLPPNEVFKIVLSFTKIIWMGFILFKLTDKFMWQKLLFAVFKLKGALLQNI